MSREIPFLNYLRSCSSPGAAAKAVGDGDRQRLHPSGHPLSMELAMIVKHPLEPSDLDEAEQRHP